MKKISLMALLGILSLICYYFFSTPFSSNAASVNGVVISVNTTPANGGTGCSNGAGQTFTITTGSGTATITGTVSGNTITSFVATPTVGGSGYSTGTVPVTGASCTGASVTIITVSATDSFSVSGNVTSGISITAGSDLVLSSLSAFVGGSAAGTGSMTVKTNNSAGYTLSIYKDHTFYTNGGGTNKQFSDYTEITSGTPDYNWITTADGATSFGFSIHSLGSSVTADQKFLNDGSNCNTSSSFTADKCWYKIPNSTPLLIASRATPTDTSGITTAINIKAEIGNPTSGSYLSSGTYSSMITATATIN